LDRVAGTDIRFTTKEFQSCEDRLKLDKPRRETIMVIDQSGVDSLIAHLAKDPGSISIDAERASGFRYSQRAYLIQLSLRDQEIFMVDPIVLNEVAEGWNIGLAKELNNRTWILHAATQDLPCLAELGFVPKAIIDTELGARLAGFERVGLGSLAAELLDIELAKEHSAADWSIRPLSDAMLDYGALDVDILHELWDAVEASLTEQNKLSWAQQEFDHLLKFKPKVPLLEPWRSLPGLSKIKDELKLKIAASLWLTRDKIARAEDLAPGRLVPDRSIMAAVEQKPRSKRELASNKAFQGRASRTRLDDWWAAIERAPEVVIDENPERGNGIPNHRSWEKRFPEAHIRLNAVRPLMLELATELKLPIENLLTPDYLRRAMFEPHEDLATQLADLGARPWQIQLVLPVITAGLIQAQTEIDSPAA
jgi:ribonuclease D